MAGAPGEGSGDRLNTELNLVPFIDLLSSLVLFLLVTTIWMQVGTITVSADSQGKAAQPEAAKDDTTKGVDEVFVAPCTLPIKNGVLFVAEVKTVNGSLA